MEVSWSFVQVCQVLNWLFKYNRRGYRDLKEIPNNDMQCHAFCAFASCTIRTRHCFLKTVHVSLPSLIFPVFSVWYLPVWAAWLPLALEAGGLWSLGRALIRVPKKAWWVPDDAGEAWQSASRAKWSRRSNSCSPQTGVKLMETEVSEKSSCCGSGCTVPRSWPWT